MAVPRHIERSTKLTPAEYAQKRIDLANKYGNSQRRAEIESQFGEQAKRKGILGRMGKDPRLKRRSSARSRR